MSDENQEGKVQSCKMCFGTGIVLVGSKEDWELWDYCDCSYGEARWEEDYEDEVNRA